MYILLKNVFKDSNSLDIGINMDTIINEKSKTRKTINLIWASIGFGILYWIIESIRDVIVFEKGNEDNKVINELKFEVSKVIQSLSSL